MNDPIVEETHKIRDQMASQFQYDVCAMGKHFQHKQTLSERKTVTRSPKLSNAINRSEIA